MLDGHAPPRAASSAPRRTRTDVLSRSDVLASLRRPLTPVEDASLDELIPRVVAQFEAESGRSLMPTTEVGEVIDGEGSTVVRTRHFPVIEVTRVSVDGKQLDLSGREVEWSRDGSLRRRGGWPCQWRAIEVDYRHGYSGQWPDDLVGALADQVAFLLNTVVGRESVQLGAFSTTFAKSGVAQSWSSALRRFGGR